MINIAKHAAASRALVELHARDDALHVRVSDDGSAPVGDHGAPMRQGSGHGITGMRERAEALGGTLTAGRSGEGFVVHATLPLAVQS